MQALNFEPIVGVAQNVRLSIALAVALTPVPRSLFSDTKITRFKVMPVEAFRGVLEHPEHPPGYANAE